MRTSGSLLRSGAFQLWKKSGVRALSYLGFGLLCFVVLVLLIAGTALLFFMFISRPVATAFEADVDTTHVEFKTGNWKDSAGLFVSEDTPVDLTLQEAGALQPADGQSGAPTRIEAAEGALLTATHVYLYGMDLAPGTVVRLSAQDNSIEIKLRRPHADQGPLVTFLTTGDSKIDGNSPGPRNRETKQQWSVYPADGQHLTLRLFPRDANPQPEVKIPLLEQSFVRMEENGQSSLTGSRSVLILPRRQKDPLHLENSRLQLDDLSTPVVQTLRFNRAVKDDSASLPSFHLVLTGTTKRIGVVSAYTGATSNYADQWGDRLQNPISNRSYLFVVTAFVGLLTSISTIAALLAAFAQIAATQDQLVDHERNYSKDPPSTSRPKGSFHAPRRRPRRASPRPKLSSGPNTQLGGAQDRDRKDTDLDR